MAQSKALLQAASSAVTGPSFGIVPAGQIVPWKASDLPAPSTLVTGKSITVDIVYFLPTGVIPYQAHVFQAIAGLLGWKVKIIQAATPTPQGALAAMQAAVLDKPTAIVGSVMPPLWVAPALQKAKAEGIYTIDMHQDTTDGPGYDAYVPTAEGIQKALLGAYAVSQSDGTAHALLVDTPGFGENNVLAAKAYLATCSGCKSEWLNISASDIVDPIKTQSAVTASLATAGKLDYIVWPQGGIPLQPVVTAISASATKTTKLLVNDAEPGSIQLLKAKQIPIVVEAPSALISLIAVDDLNRLVQGQKPLAEDALRFPVSYFTAANSPTPNYQSITAAQLARSDWLTTYETAWSVQLKSAILGVTS